MIKVYCMRGLVLTAAVAAFFLAASGLALYFSLLEPEAAGTGSLIKAGGQTNEAALTGMTARSGNFPIWQNFYDTFKKINYPFKPSPKFYDTVKRIGDRYRR